MTPLAKYPDGTEVLPGDVVTHYGRRYTVLSIWIDGAGGNVTLYTPGGYSAPRVNSRDLTLVTRPARKENPC